MNQDQWPPPPGAATHHAMIGAMGGSPALAAAAAGALEAGRLDDSVLSPTRLRYEQEQAYFNATHLLAPLAYFVLAFDTTILQANLAGAALLGLDRERLGRQLFRAFISPAFLDDFDRFVQVALNTSVAQRVQLDLLPLAQRPGLAVTLHASADGSGQAFRVELEPAEGRQAALERSEERFRRIVHCAEEGIWELDADARTTFVNPKMAQMLGYPIEAMLQRPLIDFMDAEGRALLERNIALHQQGSPERHEFKFLRQDGSALWLHLSTNPIVDGVGGYLGALALATDITATRQPSDLVWQQANFDQLTALPNRHMFLDRLQHELRKAQREECFLALLFVDLDQFKDINERLGQERGDSLLAEAGRRIAACVRGSDTVARVGGDQFAVVLAGLEQILCVERVAQQIVASLARPFGLTAAQQLAAGDAADPAPAAQLSASIGIALYPSDGAEGAALLRHAAQAMDEAKADGSSRYSYFTPDMQAAAQLRQRTGVELREALAWQQFELYYQPIVNLRSGAIERAEALLRWHHPQRGLLGPADCIPFAESSGLIIDIGDWVFRQAVQQVKCWQRELGPGFQISVNKSPVQFRSDAAFYQGWIDYLAEQQLPPRSIVIEITEGVVLDGARHVVDRLRQFRAMGLQVALDNFGTGYASLSHLKKFDLDFLKIDRTFVHELEGDAGNQALCGAIVMLAHKLGLRVVAEGVETVGQRDLLVAAGCDYAQGFVFAAPMPAAQFGALAQSRLSMLS
ncbi:MAG: EAL domain-containing protein [Pseudomonadota bacterium]